MQNFGKKGKRKTGMPKRYPEKGDLKSTPLSHSQKRKERASNGAIKKKGITVTHSAKRTPQI